MTDYSLDWPRALGLETLPAVFRETPRDFFVEEVLGFEPTGEGEHLWLFIEKTNLNTMDVVQWLSSKTGVKTRDIGFSGLKDKLAITRQWFSLRYPGELDGSMPEHITLLRKVRNSRKLRHGNHRANHFVITLREITPSDYLLGHWTESVKGCGVPNYFGLQRFGRHGTNLQRAAALSLDGKSRVSRHQRGLYLSAARAYLFNRVLAKRVSSGDWDKPLPGDVMALEGSSSVFHADDSDTEIVRRLSEGDIHPTGPLWGIGESMVTADVKTLENNIIQDFGELKTVVEKAGIKSMRRPLRVLPQQFSITAEAGKVVVEFILPSGTYATSVLREMVKAPGL